MVIKNLSKINRLNKSPYVTFGDVVYQPGGTCGPRVQPDFQLVILYSGGLQVRVDDKPQQLAEQSVMLMRPGYQEFFQFSRERITHHGWCAVHPMLVSATLSQSLVTAAVCLPLTTHLQSLLELGLALPPGDVPATQAVLDQLGLVALHEFVRESELTHSADPLPDAVRRARQMMDMRFAEPLTLGDLAKTASVTPQHLIRQFQKYMQITPVRYLWQVRLAHGLVLLRETGLSISEIAERVGFQSAFHFSRLVKQRYQHSPRELRARSWQPEK